MKAFLNEDVIVYFSERDGATEVGNIPARKKGVGLERLRFDGEKIVDLFDLDEIWVRPVTHGFFELHCMEVPGSHCVVMNYPDRKRLVLENGMVRVRTKEEINAEDLEELKKTLKNRFERQISICLGNVNEQIQFLLKLVLALIRFQRGPSAESGIFLDEFLVQAGSVYSLAEVKEELLAGAQKLAVAVEDYKQQIDQVKTRKVNG